jgi:Bifunctional DNA primase/polymerase, N-terminal
MTRPAAQNLRASDTALDYIRRGLAVVPVPFQEKGPQLKGWQQLRIKPEQVARYFPHQMNIGVILGVASGGLSTLISTARKRSKLAARFCRRPALFSDAPVSPAHIACTGSMA